MPSVSAARSGGERRPNVPTPPLEWEGSGQARGFSADSVYCLFSGLLKISWAVLTKVASASAGFTFLTNASCMRSPMTYFVVISENAPSGGNHDEVRQIG